MSKITTDEFIDLAEANEIPRTEKLSNDIAWGDEPVDKMFELSAELETELNKARIHAHKMGNRASIAEGKLELLQLEMHDLKIELAAADIILKAAEASK